MTVMTSHSQELYNFTKTLKIKDMKKAILFLLLLISTIGWSQNPTPFPDGIRTKRIVPIPLTTLQIAGLPAQVTGTMVFNSTLGFWQYYNGSLWVALGGSTPDLNDVLLEGNTTDEHAIFGTSGVTTDISAGYIANTIGDASVYLSNVLTIADISGQNISLSSDGFNFGKSMDFSVSLQPRSISFNDLTNGGMLNIGVPGGIPTIGFQTAFQQGYIRGTNLFYDAIYLELPTLSATSEVRTIPVSVNGNYSDVAGNISISSLPTSSEWGDVMINGNITEADAQFNAGSRINFFDGINNGWLEDGTKSANRTRTLSNASGYIPMTVEGQASDANGNITIGLSSYELLSNKQTDLTASATKYPTVNAVNTGLALKSNVASPTFTGTVTTPAIIVSSETASRVAIFDGSKNIKSADTATYPSLTELSYGKGVTSGIQSQLDARLLKTTATTGAVISFAVPQIYNTYSSPTASNITDDLTGAQIGVVQKIYSNKSAEPTYPAGWVKLGTGSYVNSSLNIIYAEWVSGTRVEYWITQ